MLGAAPYLGGKWIYHGYRMTCVSPLEEWLVENLPFIRTGGHKADYPKDIIERHGGIVTNGMLRPRLYAVLLAVFAAVAVALAAIGIYGVLAHAVSRRTREIGIRLALGAPRMEVIRLVLRQMTVWILAGVVVGVAGAATLTRSLEGLLFGLTPLDATTFASVVVMFVAVAAVASYLPARRAVRVDPMTALRAE